MLISPYSHVLNPPSLFSLQMVDGSLFGIIFFRHQKHICRAGYRCKSIPAAASNPIAISDASPFFYLFFYVTLAMPVLLFLSRKLCENVTQIRCLSTAFSFSVSLSVFYLSCFSCPFFVRICRFTFAYFVCFSVCLSVHLFTSHFVFLLLSVYFLVAVCMSFFLGLFRLLSVTSLPPSSSLSLNRPKPTSKN